MKKDINRQRPTFTLKYLLISDKLIKKMEVSKITATKWRMLGKTV